MDNNNFKTSALDIWNNEKNNGNLMTFCKALDNALGKGIPVGIITELSGAPGSGKTQLCLQLCINVQIPENIGGMGARAIFIDTNQGFNLNRFKEIGLSCIHRYNKAMDIKKATAKKEHFNCHKILNNTKYIYIESYSQLLTYVINLKTTLTNKENVKLIVIDSFSFLFRIFDCPNKRTRIIYAILTDLQILADKLKLSVVVTNELTTILYENLQRDICPALGMSFAHKVGQRIILDKVTENDGQYIAILEKCFNSPRSIIPFEITRDGIRGIHKIIDKKR